MKNNQLILEQVPIGKLSNSIVSEDIKDLRNSVYNPAASLERKIQIIETDAFSFKPRKSTGNKNQR